MGSYCQFLLIEGKSLEHIPGSLTRQVKAGTPPGAQGFLRVHTQGETLVRAKEEYMRDADRYNRSASTKKGKK
jgi:hypothetical protein